MRLFSVQSRWLGARGWIEFDDAFLKEVIKKKPHSGYMLPLAGDTVFGVSFQPQPEMIGLYAIERELVIRAKTEETFPCHFVSTAGILIAD